MGIMDGLIHNATTDRAPVHDGETRLDYLGRGAMQGGIEGAIEYRKSGDLGKTYEKALRGIQAGAINDIGSLVQGIRAAVTGDESIANDYNIYSPRSLDDTLRGVNLGDDEAATHTVRTAEGKDVRIDSQDAYKLARKTVDQVKQTGADLLKTAAFGALAEGWNRANGFFSNPVSNTANTLEQAAQVDNRRDIG